MKLEIKERKRNPLMKREDVLITIDHEGKATPNRAQLMEDVAKLLKTRKENIVVNRIITAGGSTLSEAKVFSYSRKDDIPEWRHKKMEARMSKKKGGEPKPAEAAPQEAPKEEKPSEEAKPSEEPTKEEPKPEESPTEDKKEESNPEGEKPPEKKEDKE